jgi:hypothetical protein
MPILEPGVQAEEMIARLGEHLREEGRARSAFGLEIWMRADRHDPEAWAQKADYWRKLGADMIMLRPMYRMFDLRDQIDMLRAFKSAVAA